MEDEILSLQNKMKSLEKENRYLKSLLDQAGIIMYLPKRKIWICLNPIKGRGSYPERLQITMQICFLVCSGDARMCMQNVLSKNPRERSIIIHSVTIFGSQDVQE